MVERSRGLHVGTVCWDSLPCLGHLLPHALDVGVPSSGKQWQHGWLILPFMSCVPTAEVCPRNLKGCPAVG